MENAIYKKESTFSLQDINKWHFAKMLWYLVSAAA